MFHLAAARWQHIRSLSLLTLWHHPSEARSKSCPNGGLGKRSGADPGFFKVGFRLRSTSKKGGPRGGPTLGPMLKSLQRAPPPKGVVVD